MNNYYVLPKNIRSKPLTIDEALEKVGDSGLYQVLMTVLFVLQWVWLSIIFISPSFLYIPPTFLCPESCTEDSGGCILKNIDNFSKASISKDFGLFCENKSIRSLGESIANIGGVFCMFVFNFVSIKRTLGMKFSMGIASAASLALAFMPNYQTTIIAMFFAGFSYNCCVLQLSFLTEQTNTKFREKATQATFIGWTVMSMLLGLIAYCMKNWRLYAFFAYGLFGIILFFGNWILLESPRYLYLYKKEDAVNVLNKIAKINKMPYLKNDELEDLTEEQREINLKKYNYYYWDLFSYKSLRRFIICAGIMEYFSQLSYYGSLIAANQIGFNIYINISLGAFAETLSYIFCLFVIHKTKRRNMMIILICLHMICNFSFIFIKIPQDCIGFCKEKALQTIFAFLGRFFVCAYFGYYFIYLEELLPTSVKNVGLALTRVIGAAGSSTGPFAVQLADALKINQMVILGVSAGIAMLFTFSMKETFNKVIPDQIDELNATKLSTLEKDG